MASIEHKRQAQMRSGRRAQCYLFIFTPTVDRTPHLNYISVIHRFPTPVITLCIALQLIFVHCNILCFRHPTYATLICKYFEICYKCITLSTLIGPRSSDHAAADDDVVGNASALIISCCITPQNDTRCHVMFQMMRFSLDIDQFRSNELELGINF